MILLTGFEPFGGESVNPSWLAAKAAADILGAEGFDANAVELPCVFGESLAALDAALARHQPELVVCAGQAGGRASISVERVAINCDDARIPDNAGNRPVDRPVVAEGPAAYFSALPIKAALHALISVGIPAEISQTAGTYVCNHVFYGLMQRIAQADGAIRGGFVHVPFSTDQVAERPDQPSLPVHVMAQALAVVVRTGLARREDLPLAAGAIH